MNEKDQRNYDLQERLIEFAVRVLNVVESLPNSRVGNHVAGQLIRSGTSPAPNYGEAQSAESRKDFIHKMKVALKELRETLVWLLNASRWSNRLTSAARSSMKTMNSSPFSWRVSPPHKRT